MIEGPPDLVLETFDAAPTAHDEGIIGSDHRNDIHPFFFKFVVLLKVRGEVIRVASRLTDRGESRLSGTLSEESEDTHRESTRDRDNHDLLSLPLIGTQCGSCLFFPGCRKHITKFWNLSYGFRTQANEAIRKQHLVSEQQPRLTLSSSFGVHGM